MIFKGFSKNKSLIRKFLNIKMLGMDKKNKDLLLKILFVD